MSKRENSGARQAYAPNMDAPSKRGHGNRGLIGAILTLLLPPVGMAYLWRRGVFRTRGRMVLTAMGTIVMGVWCFLLLPERELLSDPPRPVTPAQVTIAPDDGTSTALSNLDELLAQRQAERDAAAGITPEPTATVDADYQAEQEAILHTIVYCYDGAGARYYHSQRVCNTQSNFRELTIEEAMLEGMGACPECNPPVYMGQ